MRVLYEWTPTVTFCHQMDESTYTTLMDQLSLRAESLSIVELKKRIEFFDQHISTSSLPVAKKAEYTKPYFPT